MYIVNVVCCKYINVCKVCCNYGGCNGCGFCVVGCDVGCNIGV